MKIQLQIHNETAIKQLMLKLYDYMSLRWTKLITDLLALTLN